MPELPEVETITNDLKHTVVDATIIDFWTNSPQQVLPSEKIVKKAIVGKKITKADRRAKLIILQLDSYSSSEARSLKDSSRLLASNNKSVFLGIHLKMTGRLLLRKKGDPPDPYTHVIFYLTRHSGKSLDFARDKLRDSRIDSGQARMTNNDLELRFCDVRKFGYVKLFKDKEELNRVVYSKLGPEPFNSEFTAEYLQKVFCRKSSPIKTVLMDQSVISGIGNIYANEALYLAGIEPRRNANSLKFKEFKSLKDSIQKVLKKGIKYRGSSAKDESYRDLFGELGQYQKHFLVYEQKGKLCQKCQSVIKYQKVTGRGTFWCPQCQK